MKYETQWDKSRRTFYDKVQKKMVTTYTARYQVSDFDGLKTAAENALGANYVGFDVFETTTRQITSIEYVDQATPADNDVINLQLDEVLEQFLQATGMTTWA